MKRPNENNMNNNKKQKLEEKTPEIGIIESVCLRNFMCHDNLKFDFDPHVNFIIGQNGSGKSAILTGIILALGGKSSATGRYSNIRGFIKTGKQKAFLSVTLKNEGHFAYKPDLYGEKVIVEREINVDGISIYKLKSDAGRIISTGKEELNNVLNAMDIQIENPVLVLTQETSRTFLKPGKDEKLYDFFYRGTGLQVLEEKYQQVRLSKDEAANEMEVKEKAVTAMEKEVKKYKALIDSNSKIAVLKNELVWANVTQIEKIVEEKTKQKEKLVKHIAINKRESENCKNAYKTECLKLEQFLKERTECDTRMATQRKSLQELNVQRDSCAENVRKSQGLFELYKREEKKQLEDILALEKSIQENNDKNQSNLEEIKRARNLEIQTLEAEVLSATAGQEVLKQETNMVLQEQSAARQEEDSLQAEINSYEYKKRKLQQDLTHLKKATTDRQILFGDHTPFILAEIKQRSSEFNKLPKGPIGLYIEVKEPKWNSAVEACLQPGMLRSYCCDNNQDSSLLTKILKKYYTSFVPSVIVSKYLPNVHDVSRHKTQSNFPTVFDMLGIKDPVIANCLIDQINIESKILIEDIQTAQQVMLDAPPKNCSAAFLLNCDEILLNPYRHYSSTVKSRNMLQSVSQHHIRTMEAEYKQVMEDLESKKQELSELHKRLKKFPEQAKEIETRYVELTHKRTKYANLIYELQQYEEPKDVFGMQEDLQSLKVDLAKKQEEIESARQYLINHKAEYKKVSQMLEVLKATVTDEKSTFDALGKKINACGQHKETLSSGKKEYESILKNSEAELKELEVQLTKDVENAKRVIDGANKICKRISTERCLDEINSQIENIEKFIRKQSDCDRADLDEKYTEKRNKLIQNGKDLKTLNKYISTLNRMLKTREKKLMEIIKHTKNCLDLSFAVILKGNGFTGRLDFSKNRCLVLEATPRQENPEAGGQKSCSSLSGGERSFVTIAFLLAMWDRIKMPFRILDEYDVFMDSSNRHLSINLLITRADFMKNVQFIFLSPLELPEMRESDNIKVHKMPAPKRIGLSTLETQEEE